MFEFLYRVADDKVVKVSDYSIAPLYKGDFYLSNDHISITKWWAPEILDVEKGSTPGFSHKTDCVSFLWVTPICSLPAQADGLHTVYRKIFAPVVFLPLSSKGESKLGELSLFLFLKMNTKVFGRIK